MKKTNTRLGFDESVEVDPETTRTVRRIERLRNVLERRQFNLHLVLEDVHDPHNVSAVLRTCDAVGVGTVHLVYVNEEFPNIGRQSSAGVGKWVEMKRHTSIKECYDCLREEGVTIFATDLSGDAISLYELDMTGAVALVFGNEHRGVSEEASRLADGNILIPMVGLAQSLNISVACAVTLYEAMRQRLEGGRYEIPSIPQREIEVLLDQWAKK